MHPKKKKFIEWPRWQSRKILSTPPPTGTPKLQLFTEELLVRKTGKLLEKIFFY